MQFIMEQHLELQTACVAQGGSEKDCAML